VPPYPSRLEKALAGEDAQGGAVVLVDVDFDFLTLPQRRQAS
jgi:hypothetical protein